MASKDTDNHKFCAGTEYQMHKSQRACFTGVMYKIVDYTEHRLKRYAESVHDPQQRATLFGLLDRYRKGMVAIAWRGGLPVWLNVTKDA